MHHSIKNIKWHHPSFLFFASVSGICVIITLLAQYSVARNFTKSQSNFLRYCELLSNVDTTTFDSYNFEHISQSFNLNPQQSIEFRLLCNDVILESVRRSSVQYRKDFLHNKIGHEFVMDIRNLIEEQTARIRHEYEAMQVWCGILTILFLVFSFYSLFKADDLVAQGKSGLSELHSLRREGKSEIEKLSNDKTKAFQDIKESASKKLDEVINEKFFNINQINQMVNVSEKAITSMVDNAKSDLDVALSKFLIDADAKVDEIKKMSTLDNAKIDGFEAKIDNLEVKIKAIQGQIVSVVSNLKNLNDASNE